MKKIALTATAFIILTTAPAQNENRHRDPPAYQDTGKNIRPDTRDTPRTNQRYKQHERNNNNTDQTNRKRTDTMLNRSDDNTNWHDKKHPAP